jgi:hypothetical protein
VACGAAARSEEEDDPGWPSWDEWLDNSGRQGKIPRKRKKINGPQGILGCVEKKKKIFRF